MPGHKLRTTRPRLYLFGVHRYRGPGVPPAAPGPWQLLGRRVGLRAADAELRANLAGRARVLRDTEQWVVVYLFREGDRPRLRYTGPLGWFAGDPS